MMSREGEVLFNGAKMEKHMKRAIGYVMQDDLLYESLTVFEVVKPPLYFQDFSPPAYRKTASGPHPSYLFQSPGRCHLPC